MLDNRRQVVTVLGDGLSGRTIRLVGSVLARAGLSVSGDPAAADLLVLAHGREREARIRRPEAPVLSLTSSVRDEVAALRRGATGVLTLPFDGRRLIEWVNRLLLVGDRRRLVGNLIGLRKAMRRVERERDVGRTLGLLYWGPKLGDLTDVWSRIGPAQGPREDFEAALAEGVAGRAGRDLFDDLLPLAIDLEFQSRRREERLEAGESFAGETYYRHLLDAKIRLEELLDWPLVRSALGPRASASDWIRTPPLDRLAVETARDGRLPELETPALRRLVRDLRHFHRALEG